MQSCTFEKRPCGHAAGSRPLCSEVALSAVFSVEDGGEFESSMVRMRSAQPLAMQYLLLQALGIAT